MKKYVRVILLLIIVFSVVNVYGQGCSQCRLLSEQNAEADDFGPSGNINMGIIYLMILPYLLLLLLFRKKIFTFLKNLPKKTSK